ncbi:MAG: HAD-IIIA family hydrolase [Acidimicrobiales bacterium]
MPAADDITIPIPITAPSPVPRGFLFDRDGTLVHDVPYNGQPARVRPLPTAAAAVALARAAGCRTAIVSNQRGVALGLLTVAQVEAVNARVQRLLGRFDAVLWCPHDDVDDCDCRKPRPGLVLAAAERLGLRPDECVVFGDTGADVGAALAAGAAAVLVPNDATEPDEVDAAPCVAPTLSAAVRLALAGSVPPAPRLDADPAARLSRLSRPAPSRGDARRASGRAAR